METQTGKEKKKTGGKVGKPPINDPDDKTTKGRPLKYSGEYHPLLVEIMAQAGMTDAQMATKLGIAESTFHKWKNDFPQFSEALKRGKSTPDDQVQAALFRRAIGFERHDAVKVFMPAGAKAPGYAKYTEYFPPDVMAIIYWLNNRRPDRWKKNPEGNPGEGDDNRLVIDFKE